MNYYKLINDNSIEMLKNNALILDGRVYTNPSQERLKAHGYKPLLSEDEPEYDKENEFLERIYTQTEDSIIESFIIRKRSGSYENSSL